LNLPSEQDTYTLYFACTIFGFCSIVVMAMVLYVHDDEPATKFWFFGFLFYFLALFLSVSSDASGPIILRNALLMGACMLSYKGVMKFLGIASSTAGWLVMITVALFSIAYWTLISPSLGFRNLVSSVVSMPFYLLMAFHLFSAKGTRGQLTLYRTLGSIHTLTALGLAARIEPLISVGNVPITALDIGLVGPIALLAVAIVIFTTSFCYTLLISGKIKKQLARQAHYDGLTKLRNRHGFFHKAKFLRGQCGIMVIDFDEFKMLNDTYGHAAGDHTLITFSSALKQRLRSADICARAGGEEFWVAIPGATLQETAVVATRIKSGIAGSSVIFDNSTFHYTVSIGVTTMCVDTVDDLHSAILEADNLLLEAKRKGRNQVVTPLSFTGDSAPLLEPADA
jgi:diguanylate cyclase (GGDEF)-like protein